MSKNVNTLPDNFLYTYQDGVDYTVGQLLIKDKKMYRVVEDFNTIVGDESRYLAPFKVPVSIGSEVMLGPFDINMNDVTMATPEGYVITGMRAYNATLVGSIRIRFNWYILYRRVS